MTSTILIALCVLVLVAYLFDISAARTRIPSVILLLLLGLGIRQGANWAATTLPDLHELLPILGTVGLILIVLEGSIELEINKERWPVVRKSLITATMPMMIFALGLTIFISWFLGYGYRDTLLNILPLSVISSAIAIPTARNLMREQREFVVYESSVSDILGVIIFNFVLVHESVSFTAIGSFFLQLVLMVLISFTAAAGLSLLLSRINHSVKFIPIIFMVILVYAIAKHFHLPSLLFVLVFGLFLGNLDHLSAFRWLRHFHPEALEREVVKLDEITKEAAFLVRVLFFLLFGFMMNTEEILSVDALAWSGGITASIFIIRAVQLLILRVPLLPLVFIAPRGLITVLLFMSVPASSALPIINSALVTQVVLLTALFMMGGMMLVPKTKV